MGMAQEGNLHSVPSKDVTADKGQRESPTQNEVKMAPFRSHPVKTCAGFVLGTELTGAPWA